MHHKLTSFFTRHDIITADQYGFQKNKSTTLATFNLVNEILHKRNSNHYVSVLFFDMSKAFDFVNHDLLLQKLQQYGIRGQALNWIYTYLSNRLQSTEITQVTKKCISKAHKSKFMLNRSGVPQGSVLGPLLFLLYVNDLPKITNYRSILFADDISIIISTPKEKSLTWHQSQINDVLLTVVTWLHNNNLTVNLSKTKYMNFNNVDIFNIKYNDITIDNTNNTQFLGISIDNDLKWKQQIDIVCGKLSRFSYALHKLTKVVNRRTATISYFAYVESVLRYGLLIWGNSTDINKAFVCQKKCIRAIYGVPPDTPCRPLFKKLNVLPLPCLYILNVAIFVKKYTYLFTQTKDIVVGRTLRNMKLLVHDECPKSESYARNCYSMCIKINNKIPDLLKELPVHRFRKSLRAWLMTHLFYSTREFLQNTSFHPLS